MATYLITPQPGEYDPYYNRYISLVSTTNINQTLERQISDTRALLSGLTEREGDFCYAPNKWSTKQVLGHLIDSERIFAYRALRVARGDRTPIEGFEQDDYVRNGPFVRSHLADLIEEFSAVRQSTVYFFRDLDVEAWTRRGVANNCEISVRALAYIVAGHELHHRKILAERYVGMMGKTVNG